MRMNDESRKLTHSAIGSWSGYIYQGMCAVYVVLNAILKEYQSNKNVDQIKGYLLYLDAYDDFSIHNENNQAISLHQCKLHKQTQEFEEAQKQLLETKRYWVEQNVCDEDTVVYFHSNQSPNLIDGISSFEDFEGNVSFDADTLSRKMRGLITKIFEEQGIERPQERVYNALISWVDRQVTTIYGRFLKQKVALREVAIEKESAIRFDKIISILFEDDLAEYPPQDFYKLLKYEILHSIKEEIEENYETEDDWDGGNPEFVQDFVDCIGKTPIANFEHIVQRLLPVEDIHPSEKSERNVCNSSIAQEFIQLVAKCSFRLRVELDWNEQSKRQTPIAVKHLNLSQTCKQLYKNRANLDCLREYDILVTKEGNEFIPNIRDKALIIGSTDTTNDDDKNIFKEKKVGLLSVSKFNAGDYE
ncbi:ABC-three component system protein [Porphyromonas gingivalis]|uniref:ABC-three component system protein n=1 Tax=Porphyromonas gingivalis TaxID=837 RepID=UPI001C53A3E1|nr:ABC-three component system protein [Porphyromonas gingivalis]